jgi:hypothetical protein
MYKDLLQAITYHRDDYYELLLDYADPILLQIAKTSKTEVAKDLNMTPSVFSTALKFIKAYSAKQDIREIPNTIFLQPSLTAEEVKEMLTTGTGVTLITAADGTPTSTGIPLKDMIKDIDEDNC